eukprot:7240808-Ditylum_brightwellii.AAC.1
MEDLVGTKERELLKLRGSYEDTLGSLEQSKHDYTSLSKDMRLKETDRHEEVQTLKLKLQESQLQLSSVSVNEANAKNEIA